MRPPLVVAGVLAVMGCSSTKPADASDAPKQTPDPSTQEAPAKPTPPDTEPAEEMPTTIKLIVGERTRVAEAVEVTFLGNGHKMIESGVSPLGITIMVHRDGQDIYTSEWVFVPEYPRFDAAGLKFEYVAHTYDQTIELKLIGVEPAPK